MLALGAFAVLLAQDPAPLEGLREGERWSVLPPTAADESARAHGRLIDATNGAPVEGATVEAWTEDWEEDAALVDTATSGRDGGFSLRCVVGSARAEKVRVRSSGHRSTVLAVSSLGDGDVLLLPRPAPVALRVLDLDGRPIAGARLRTHQTCAHAPPASVAVSDAEGVLRCEDFPPFAEGPEGQIEASGFAALFEDDPSERWCEPDVGEPPSIRLGRRRPLVVRFLDAAGRPARDLRVISHQGSAWQERNADGTGRVVFDAPLEPRFLLQAHLEGELQTLYEGPSFAPQELTLRIGGEFWEWKGEKSATLAVRVEEGAPAVPILIAHEAGWFETSAGVHAFPPGKVHVFYGADFSGWQPQVAEVELAAGEKRELILRPRREPILRVSLMPMNLKREGDVIVEADGESVRARGEREVSVPVPPQTRLRVLAQSGRDIRRATLDGLERDGEVLVGRRIDEGADPVAERERRATLRFDVRAQFTEAVQIRLFGRGAELDDEVLRSAGFHARVAPRAPFEAWISAPGRVTRAVNGFAPGAEGTRSIDASLAPLARVRLSGTFAGARDGAEEIEGTVDTTDPAAREWSATPGRHALEIGMGDGRRLRVDLVLQPGEFRELALR